jgi:hypothetical protein
MENPPDSFYGNGENGAIVSRARGWTSTPEVRIAVDFERGEEKERREDGTAHPHFPGSAISRCECDRSTGKPRLHSTARKPGEGTGSVPFIAFITIITIA